jgi:hypothetical protein
MAPHRLQLWRTLGKQVKIIRFLLKAIITFYILFIYLMILPFAVAGESQVKLNIGEIKQKYNIHVHYSYNSYSYFPASWQKAPISARGQQLALSQVERLLPIIDTFLSAYPIMVLNKNLNDIYLLEDLIFYSKSFGATNSRDGLYITSGELSKGFTDLFLLGRMHSELSSILMRNYIFPKKEWEEINSSEFEYVGNGVKMLGQARLYSQDNELLSNGFIVNYATSSIENDFNMISDWLFTRPKELRQLGQKLI